jgi:hypothetical protein
MMRHVTLLLALVACTPAPITDDKDDTDGGTSDTTDTTTDTGSGFTDTVTDTDTVTTLQDCPSEPDVIGPWDTHPITVAGTGWTRDPPANDAGISAVLAAVAGQTYAITIDLPITGAIVTSRGYVPAAPTENTVTMWLEDSSGAITTFQMDIGIDPNLVNPGDSVSFTATEAVEYFGTAEITAATDFQILSSANDVHIVDGMSGPALTFASDGMRTVEVWGQLVAGPTDCGGRNCWDFEYNGNTVVFRSGSTFDYLGDCIHYIGPLGQFDSAPQLNAEDYDWYDYF